MIPYFAFGQTKKKLITPADLVKYELTETYVISPDNKMVAFSGQSGVWLWSLGGEEARLIAKRKDSGSTYRELKWSEDGKKLAIGSNGIGGPGIAIWDSATDKVQEILDQELHTAPYGLRFFEWLDNYRIVCDVLPRGQFSYGTERAAIEGWTKYWRGAEETASVLRSGAESGAPVGQPSELMVLDVDGGVISRYDTGILARVELSPDRKHIAYLRQKPLAKADPKAELFGDYLYTYSLAVLDLTDAFQLTEQYEFSVRSRFPDPDHPWIRWKPGTDEVAIATYIGGDSATRQSQWFRCDSQSPKCVQVKGPDELARIEDVRWGPGGDLFVYADSEKRFSLPAQSKRHDWWLARQHDVFINLTGSLPHSPLPEINFAKDAKLLFVLSDGELLRTDLTTKRTDKVARGLDQKVERIVWAGQEDSQEIAIVSVKGADGLDLFYRINSISGEVREVSKPQQKSDLIAYSRGVSVFVSYGPEVLYGWVCREAGRCVEIKEANPFRPDFAGFESKKIIYRSLDGQELSAELDLPIGFQEHVKYPLIAVVYAGAVFGSELFDAGEFNRMLTAHGYAVITPSMPLPPEGEASDPYREMLNGVLPAVDKVIDMGIADAARLGVIGVSYGGYSVYSIISQTNRFHAAVSMAGPSDLTSEYGEFFGSSRYATGYTLGPEIENGQMRMGNPPWKDPVRYTRNSPIFYADRIQTPLMIVQGDQDFVAIEQGEEMFSALKRQDKRAEFVRYWGEGHGISNGQNQKDLWERIYAWFDEFLVNANPNDGTQPRGAAGDRTDH
jgi:dipeptidyl aminopeptidase/acylaminoacyl peptidase